ncbi:MAG: gliding motility-associated C-terminal domain-containing protein [Bacteroidales bacterium]|nr:gliding motility-associated C-terminal domain-containing protein [Bacteroidales bacterium]
MKKYILLSIAIFLWTFSNAQFYVSVSSNQLNDTVRTCVDTSITFYAYGIYDGDTVPEMNFKWDFDDNTLESDIELDTIEHSFNDQQAYRILVTVWNDTLWGYNIIPVKIGIDPLFDGTKVDIPSEQTGICLGEKVKLIGVTEPDEWEETRQNIVTEVFPQYITDTETYLSALTRRSFNLDDTFELSTDIDKIGVNIEHSNTANVRITLTCPIGKEVVLKDSGGVEKAFGEPIIEPDNYSEGVGYWYYWSNTPTFGTMNTYSGTEDTLPSGFYQSDSLWTKFIGCPLNGDWVLKVTDETADDNDGYLFEWALFFNEDIETDTLKYQNTYFVESWSDGVTNQSEGTSIVEPDDYGEYKYTFTVSDDFGCIHETDVNVTAEKPFFEKDQETMRCGDSVKLEDKTSWAISWKWDFGDESDLGNEEIEYKKYEYQGIYPIEMIVRSESGCKDNFIDSITITPRFDDVEEYNIFTPNGDGVNDVFTFFHSPDEIINAANIENIHGRIFNRYGEIVCSWETPEEAIAGWDGTIKNKGGREAPAGFYYYVLIITTKELDDKSKFTKKEPVGGTIFLYRTKE